MNTGVLTHQPANPPRSAHELRGRTFVAAVLLVIIIGAIQAPTLVLTMVLAIAAGLGSLELFENTAARQIRSYRPHLFAAASCVLIGAALPITAYLLPKLYWVHLALAGFTLALLTLSAHLHLWQSNRQPLWPMVVLSGFVCTWYIGGTLAALVPIHLSPHGPGWLLIVLGLNVASDTGGYVAGRSWPRFAGRLWTPQRQRHPPCPTISPGKTWAGFIGGAVATLAVGSILGYWHQDWSYLALAAAVTVAAPFGDLFASWLKRRLGIKDWSRWLGHHGGFLDRLDSLIWTAATSYIVLTITGHVPI